MFNALQLVPITNIQITADDPTVSTPSNYRLIFTPQNLITKDSSLVITLPSQISIQNVNSLSICQNVFESKTLSCVVSVNA